MSRMVTAPGRAKEYETIYILRPDVDADAAERVSGRVGEVVGRDGGKLTKVELWGRRRLAYDIKKHKRGVYVYVKYLGNGTIVSEIESNLRLSDDVLKFQTVLVGSDLEHEGMAVAEDDVKFERLELPPMEEDFADSRERQLGLVEQGRAPRGSDYDHEESEGEDGESETASDDEES